MMKRTIKQIRRIRDWISMRDTERRLQDVIDLERSGDYPGAAVGLILLRKKLSADLARQRSAYVAAYKAPGQRMTFEVA